MKDIFSVWGKTKQIVLIAITAAIYAGTLIPFKPIQLVPGLTELRPASALPVLFGVLFGPAAAWGSAIGNLIADFFGMLSPASAFGFVGNFLFSYLSYLIWHAMIKDVVKIGTKEILVFILACVVSSLACAFTVGAGVQLLGMAPFKVLFLIVFINNAVMSSVIGTILLVLLYKRIEKTGLMYKNETGYKP
jgi:energy-coupling factor transport system substrate-specific component